MDPHLLRERLIQLDEEIKIVNSEAKEARKAWFSARDVQEKADLDKIWQGLVKDKDALLAERKALGVNNLGPGVSGFDEKFKKLLALVAKPPVLSTSTLQELGEHFKKRPRKTIPLPTPASGFTWNDPLWNEVAAPASKLAEAGPEGLQSKFRKLLDSAPSSTSFEFHDVHSAPSVCGNDLKPDVVMSLRGKPVCPLTTGAIIDLKRQGVSPEMDKNVGQALTYGRTCLQQLPSSLRDTVIVALTDLKTITLMRVSLRDGELDVDMSAKLPDAKHVLLQLLCCPPENLLVQLPDLGPSLQITGFLGRGATSHVFQGTTSSGQEVAIKVPLEGTLDDELQMLRSLQDLGSVPSLACDSLVEGAIVLTPILQPLTLAAIWGNCLHLAVPALVSTFQEAHNRGIFNRDVRISNLMVHSATSTLCAIDWGSATIEQHAPYEGTVHYASEAILEQLQQQQEHGHPALILLTPANDLESLVCTAFCVTHPDLRVELEKMEKHEFASILSWWQETAWARRPAWTEALQAARDEDYTTVGLRLQRLLE